MENVNSHNVTIKCTEAPEGASAIPVDRDRAVFDTMTVEQKRTVLAGLNGVRNALLGIVNRPRVGVEGALADYFETLLDQTNARLDTLYYSIIQNRPKDNKERRAWLSAVIGYYGMLEFNISDIAYDFPGFFDELRRLEAGNGEPESTTQQEPVPDETHTERPMLRGLAKLEDAENQLLDCVDTVAVQEERGEDKDRNPEGYELLFQIQCDVGAVIADNQESRTIAEAMRPCASLEDVKDRVAILLAASQEDMEETALNDVYGAVRNSILAFARKGGAS